MSSPGKFLVLLLIAFFASRSFSDVLQGDHLTPSAQEAHIAQNIQPSINPLPFSATPTEDEIFRARLFAEPLVPVGANPTGEENSELASALAIYAKRTSPDDFSSWTKFLDTHPHSPWTAGLLTDLGLEYYNTAHFSLAMDAWTRAWALSTNATDGKSFALVSRAFGELITMDSRLGRMDEIDRLLKSIGNQRLPGPAGERVVMAREALWNMQHRPEISFRCGPLALRSIRTALNLPGTSDAEIMKSASTQKGCSLLQVATLSEKIGLNYQMAFRDSEEYLVPAVVHWKVGHYAALVRKVGDLYELQDPTFGNTTTWATKTALDAETSGYFLIPSGLLPTGWRAVNEKEGATVWGKGLTSGNDPQHITKDDIATGGSCVAMGMTVPKMHLMDVNLNLIDNPLNYAPPVGLPIQFTVRYNQRDTFQPANFSYGNLGPQWTSDWFSYITDNPSNVLANVNLYVGGGGQRTYIGFNTNNQSFAYQQYDNNLLTRTGSNSYQLLYGDGSKLIFSQSDGSTGTSRNIYLTQMIDPQGNALTFGYDSNLCLVTVADALGRVTTLTYGVGSTNIGSGENEYTVPADPYKLTKVTDPFGRSVTFNYEPALVGYTKTTVITSGVITYYYSYSYGWELASLTDVIGITSQYGYDSVDTLISQTGSEMIYSVSHHVDSLTTPYGTTSFAGGDNGNTRAMEIHYPDGSRERVEYNQGNTNQPMTEPASVIPSGMATTDGFLQDRDTYYWDRKACAEAYGDYSKARLFHWLHTENLVLTSGALESVKQPLEGRVWYDYPGQSQSVIIAPTTLPTHAGRVMDDGITQLYTYGYNPFGHLTNTIDPDGRTLTYIYDTNNIDMLELRQTRAGNNELIAKATYNSQHEPLTMTDAAGQTTTYTYNTRGQLLTATNPRNEITSLHYDANGYLLSIDGPLPGTNDTTVLTYDAFDRIRTATDVSGYTVTFDYDNLNHRTRTTYPDSTFSQNYYKFLDCVEFQDRAGRQTFFQYDNMRQLTEMTDPLGRTTLFDWCRCGQLQSITDPLGRMTSWITDIQGRRIAKRYSNGSQVRYIYEKTTSRLAQTEDEQQQITHYTYNPDNTVASIHYINAAIATPPVSFTYDPNYQRVASMTDGIGTTAYSYIPITLSPALGAGNLASVTGPLTNEVASYAYDNLGRVVQVMRDGDASTLAFDAAGRITGETNGLGAFAYGYDGSSPRPASESYPNGINLAIGYSGVHQDFKIQQIAYTLGPSPVSQFGYDWDVPHQRISNWSQQAGAQSPDISTFGYDDVNQLLSAAVTNSGSLANTYAYTYDPAGNRLSEQTSASINSATYNALNQITTGASSPSHTNEWDAEHRLVAVNAGNSRTELGYDGFGHLAYLRQLENDSETSFRRFGWVDDRICEERDKSGATVVKRFYPEGVKLETGGNVGAYYYTRDHLGSIRELTDAGGAVRARYAYAPWGQKTKLTGDLDADFGFAGMFWSPEVNLSLAHFRPYDPALGRWLSRDPLHNAEVLQGPNLYTYTANNPVNLTDPSGLVWETDLFWWLQHFGTGKYEDLSDTDFAGDVAGFLSDFETLSTPGSEILFNSEATMFIPEVTDVKAGMKVPAVITPMYDSAFSKISYPGIAGPITQFIGAGITILTMTDCDTVNGIVGLVRQGKGGLLNASEDRQMREVLKSMP